MINSLFQAASKFNMAPELGAQPTEGLSATETALYFVGIPLGLFLLISVITYAATGQRKEKTEPKGSVLTHIE
jgi:hypothetical protein